LEVPILDKLWRGQYSLWITFWIFYVAGYFASSFLSIFVSPVFSTQPWRILCVIALIVPYNIVSTVGVLRSADAYPLTRWWPNLAKIAVGLWDTHIAWSLIKGVLREMNR
jgi:hypothetical protein